MIEDLSEPMHARSDAPRGSFADRAKHVAPYVRIKARAKGKAAQQIRSGYPNGAATELCWLPDLVKSGRALKPADRMNSMINLGSN